MAFDIEPGSHTGILEKALERIQGLSYLYLRHLTAARNPRIREAMERLIDEKRRQAGILEGLISKLGGNYRSVRIPLDRSVRSNRELLPRIFEEEQALSIFYREQVSAEQGEKVKELFEMLLREEQSHLEAIKDLYRDLTHC